MSSDFQISRAILDFFLLISNLILLWAEKMLCRISVLFCLSRLILWPNIWFLLTKVLHVSEKNVHSSDAGCAAKSLQSCPTLCDPIDGSPPGSPVPGILPARTLEWVAISFSNAWKWKVKVKSLSRVQLLATPWTAAYQAPPSMGFSRQEYWSGVPLPSPMLGVEFYNY